MACNFKLFQYKFQTKNLKRKGKNEVNVREFTRVVHFSSSANTSGNLALNHHHSLHWWPGCTLVGISWLDAEEQNAIVPRMRINIILKKMNLIKNEI